MAKTNFTKVEEKLDEGLRKMAVEHLLDLADSAAKPKDDNAPNKIKQDHSRLQIILVLQRDMKFLDKEGQAPYELFGINKKTINKYLKNPEKLTSEEWEEIKKTQEKVHIFRKDFEKSSPQKNDDTLIEQQRHSHITKRFNINDKWLPLS